MKMLVKPSKKCPHYHPYTCGKKISVCPIPCKRLDFYNNFHEIESNYNEQEIKNVS